MDKRVIIFLRHYVHDKARFARSSVVLDESVIGIALDEMLPARRDLLGLFLRVHFKTEEHDGALRSPKEYYRGVPRNSSVRRTRGSYDNTVQPSRFQPFLRGKLR